MSRERAGLLFCLISAAAFSTSNIFGRVALEDGAGVLTILALRYGGAATIFWGLVAANRQPLPAFGPAAPVFGLGALVLALQVALIYAALTRLNAGLVTILLYTFPAVVAVAAIVLGRERASRRKLGAVAAATIGIVLVLAGDAELRPDWIGITLALASAVLAAGWVLASDRLLQGFPPLTVSALIATGAATSLWLVGLASGAIDFDFGPSAWAAIVGTILITTVVANWTILAGMARVGPTVASILLTAEVPMGVTWATLLLGEGLKPLQIVGGALVVLAVVLLQLTTIRWPAWATARYAPLRRPADLSREVPPAP
jgi:drug/metabolite transporter (DMT)-like permease